MPAFMARTSKSYLCLSVGARRAEHDGAADLRELPAIARRDLGHDDVAALQRAAVRRRHRAIVRTGAEQQEIVLGAERLRVPLELDRKLVLAHAGPRDLEEARVAEFGDAGRLARVGDLLLGLGGAPHRTRCRRRPGRAAASASGGRRCPSGRRRARRCRSAAPRRLPWSRAEASASATSSAAMTRSVGQHSAARSASHAGVTTSAGLAVARQDDGRGPERLEAAQHHHRIGLLDEMRAVMDGDDQRRACARSCRRGWRRGVRRKS